MTCVDVTVLRWCAVKSDAAFGDSDELLGLVIVGVVKSQNGGWVFSGVVV